jgi:hypothetical protein
MSAGAGRETRSARCRRARAGRLSRDEVHRGPDVVGGLCQARLGRSPVLNVPDGEAAVCELAGNRHVERAGVLRHEVAAMQADHGQAAAVGAGAPDLGHLVPMLTVGNGLAHDADLVASASVPCEDFVKPGPEGIIRRVDHRTSILFRRCCSHRGATSGTGCHPACRGTPGLTPRRGDAAGKALGRWRRFARWLCALLRTGHAGPCPAPRPLAPLRGSAVLRRAPCRRR